jgi:hypothetical protein
MKYFLIADDNLKRSKYLAEYIKTTYPVSDAQIDIIDSVRGAIRLLKDNEYSIVFLDLILKEYSDGTELDNNAGLTLLNYLKNGKVRQPKRIIGYSANQFRSDVSQQFIEFGFSFIRADDTDFSWIQEISGQIEFVINPIINSDILPPPLKIITLHGIRSYGQWQERLEGLIKSDINSQNVSFYHFKNPMFSTLRFITPFFRRRVIESFIRDMRSCVKGNEQENYIFYAHSFGTYVLYKSLLSGQLDYLSNGLKYIVLSGSVLEQSTDLSILVDKFGCRVVNEVGVDDLVLLLSDAAVPGCGKAGQVGFVGLHGDGLVTRTFNGGHSLYFDGDNFMRNYWVPLIHDVEIQSEDVVNRRKSIVVIRTLLFPIAVIKKLLRMLSLPFVFLRNKLSTLLV